MLDSHKVDLGLGCRACRFWEQAIVILHIKMEPTLQSWGVRRHAAPAGLGTRHITPRVPPVHISLAYAPCILLWPNMRPNGSFRECLHIFLA